MRKAIPIFLVILLTALIGGLSGCRGAPTGPEMKGCEGTLSAPSYNGTAHVTFEDCESKG